MKESPTILHREPRLSRELVKNALISAISDRLPIIIKRSQLDALEKAVGEFSLTSIGQFRIDVKRKEGETHWEFVNRTNKVLEAERLKINPITVDGKNEGDDQIIQFFESTDASEETSREILQALFLALSGSSVVKYTVMVLVLPDKETKKGENNKRSKRSLVKATGSSSVGEETPKL